MDQVLANADQATTAEEPGLRSPVSLTLSRSQVDVAGFASSSAEFILEMFGSVGDIAYHAIQYKVQTVTDTKSVREGITYQELAVPLDLMQDGATTVTGSGSE